jgi:peroxisomal enoyl-CoA hydratase 2
MHAPPPVVSLAQYTARDVILYAVGVGCCSDTGVDADDGISTSAASATSIAPSDEMQYVYENHHDFAPLPTFPLSLSFTALPAEAGANYFAGIRPFPPHTMRNILPRHLVSADSDFDPSSCPILHIAQKLRLHKPIPMPDLIGDNNGNYSDQPIRVKLVTKTVSVLPKEIGAFVTTETEYWTASEPATPLFTGTSTALVVGAPKEAVLPLRREIEKSDELDARAVGPKEQDDPPSFEAFYRINPNQALLYRLSGDYNAIHVDKNLAEIAMGNRNRNRKGVGESEMSRPVLHGLCSLGFAVRGVLRFLRQREASLATRGDGFEVTYLSCRFARPVYVGDKIKVGVWDNDGDTSLDKVLGFEVLDCGSGKVVIKDGKVGIALRRRSMPRNKPSTSRSRL